MILSSKIKHGNKTQDAWEVFLIWLNKPPHTTKAALKFKAAYKEKEESKVWDRYSKSMQVRLCFSIKIAKNLVYIQNSYKKRLWVV